MTNKMKKILAIGLPAIMLALLANNAFAAETQVWTTLSVSGKIANNVTLNIEEQLRLDDGTTLARQHTDLSVGFKVNRLLDVSSGYRNTSTGEHRPYVGIGLRLLSGDLNIDSASRIELSDFETLSGRTGLTASAQVGGMTLGLSDELRANADGITGNRASIGITKGVNDTLNVTAFYMLDSTGSDLSSTAHVLGFGLGVSL